MIILQRKSPMNDVILAAIDATGNTAADISYEEMMRTMTAINEHRILVGI